MSDKPSGSPRGQNDRRRRPTSPLDAFRTGGRRTRPRRQEDRLGGFFIDRFNVVTLAMVVILLGLTIADGILTLELIEINCVEANPLMQRLLIRGPIAFLVGKYILTSAGLPLLVVYQHHPMFGTRFRVGFLIPVFIGLYLMLLSYQGALLLVAMLQTSTPSM